MKSYTWIIRIRVDPDLVADGIDLSDPLEVHRKLCLAYPYARMGGFQVDIMAAPSAERIKKEQGTK